MKKILEQADGSVIAQLTPREAALIERAVTAPIKRKIMKMSPKIQSIIDELQVAKQFNDDFIETFYLVKPKQKKRRK